MTRHFDRKRLNQLFEALCSDRPGTRMTWEEMLEILHEDMGVDSDDVDKSKADSSAPRLLQIDGVSRMKRPRSNGKFEYLQPDSRRPQFKTLEPDSIEFRVASAIVSKEDSGLGSTPREVSNYLRDLDKIQVSKALHRLLDKGFMDRRYVESSGSIRRDKYEYVPTEAGVGEVESIQEEQDRWLKGI